MTDEEWEETRDRWKKKVKDGDLMCDGNMIPFAVSLKTQEPWMWVSREYLENAQKICDDPKFKESVAEAMKSLGL
jgi:hypothetical protein